MILSSVRQTPIKSLSGYRRGHRVPDRHTLAAERFVATAAREQLEEQKERVFRAVRDVLDYRRRELSVSGPSDGVVTLTTPHFCYHHSVCQSPDDPSRALWRRELRLDIARSGGDPRFDAREAAERRSAELVFSARLDAAFADEFDTIELAATAPVDVAEIIDRIEAGEPCGIRCEDYPSDAAWCEFRVEGLDGTLRVTRDGLLLKFRAALLPSHLMGSLCEVGRALAGDGAGPALI